MQRQAETIGKRWDYCAKGYDAIVQNEFAGEVAEKWSGLLKEHAPCEKGSVILLPQWKCMTAISIPMNWTN